MKKLYMIGGPMGIGKTTISKALKEKFNQAVMLDGDWCWDMHPFIVNEETKKLVFKNIQDVLNNFIRCSEIKNIIFCWVMHEQEIIDQVLKSLDLKDVKVVQVPLLCSEDELIQRCRKDQRSQETIEKSLQRLAACRQLKGSKIDTTDQSIEAIAHKIMQLGE